MSVNKKMKTNPTKCRVSQCAWSGDVDNLFDHCERDHREIIKEMDSKNRLQMTLDDFKPSTILLTNDTGLYWMVIRSKIDSKNNEIIEIGIFATPTSEKVGYTFKFGERRLGFAQIIGVFDCGNDEDGTVADDDLPFQMGKKEIQYLPTVTSNKVELFFGDDEERVLSDPSDQFVMTSKNIIWDEESHDINAHLIREFICPICRDYIRKKARFCENKHYLDDHCYQMMKEKMGNDIKCPICKGNYLYENRSDDIDELLGVLLFPDSTDLEGDKTQNGVDGVGDSDCKMEWKIIKN